MASQEPRAMPKRLARDAIHQPWFQDFIAGSAGGMAGVLVGHPFDTIKARLQTDGFSGKNKYTGVFNCLSQTFKEERPYGKGLYKGMWSPMLGVGFINAIVFGVQGNVMKCLQSSQDLPKIRNSYITGCIAGGAQAPICCVMELLKLRMQCQIDEATHVYRGYLAAVRKIYRVYGIRGLFTGMGVTAWREVPGFGIYFACYDFLCQWSLRHYGGMTMDDVGPVTLSLAGGISGIVGWGVCYPFDVVKSRIQVDGMVGEVKYKGMVDCFKKSYTESKETHLSEEDKQRMNKYLRQLEEKLNKYETFRGCRVFFKGLTPTIVRAFPVNAVTFTTVALILRYWRNGSSQE